MPAKRLVIKCSITEQSLAVVRKENEDNQLSIDVLGYLLWTATCKHIKLVKSGNESSKENKKGSGISLHCNLASRMGTIGFTTQSL